MRVLIVDDERNIRTTLTMCLQGIGCEVTAVASGDAALLSVTAKSPELAFVDLRLANESGLELIPRLLGAQPDLAIVVGVPTTFSPGVASTFMAGMSATS